MPKGQHKGNRSQKSGLANVKGTSGRKHVEQQKPHVPQKIVQKSGNVNQKSVYKEEEVLNKFRGPNVSVTVSVLAQYTQANKGLANLIGDAI